MRGFGIRRLNLKRKKEIRCTNAAIVLQSLVRGFLTRKALRNKVILEMKNSSALKIQSLARRYIVRATLPSILYKLSLYRDKRGRRALQIQQLYRGFRARIIVRILKRESNRLKAIRDPAATKINNFVRRYQARGVLKKKKEEQMVRWIDAARGVQEMWSDEYNCWQERKKTIFFN